MTELTPDEIAVQFFENIWSRGELDVADRIIHKKYNPDWIKIPKTGPEQVKHEVKYLRSVFDRVTYGILEKSISENKIWIRYSFSGQHNGPAWGFEATKNVFKTEGVSILTIIDGKIIDRWGSFCMYDVFHQLQLIPAWYELSEYKIEKTS